MRSNGYNEPLLKHNIYAKVFIPTGLDLMCSKKYINNAGCIVNYSPNHSLCEGKSGSTLTEMQGVSLIFSHGTVHFDTAYSLDNLHTDCGSNESVSTLISIHENSYFTDLDSSNSSYIFNVSSNDTFSYFQHTLLGELENFSLFNCPICCDGDCLSSSASSSLANKRGCLQGSCAFTLNSYEVISSTSGHPSVLVEIPQHEEYIVKNTSLQTIFKGAYG